MASKALMVREVDLDSGDERTYLVVVNRNGQRVIEMPLTLDQFIRASYPPLPAETVRPTPPPQTSEIERDADRPVQESRTRPVSERPSSLKTIGDLLQESANEATISKSPARL